MGFRKSNEINICLAPPHHFWHHCLSRMYHLFLESAYCFTWAPDPDYTNLDRPRKLGFQCRSRHLERWTRWDNNRSRIHRQHFGGRSCSFGLWWMYWQPDCWIHWRAESARRKFDLQQCAKWCQHHRHDSSYPISKWRSNTKVCKPIQKTATQPFRYPQ